MITTVTLNPAIDKTYYVSSFAAGSVQRVARQIAEPGGKGNNAAKVIRQLGSDVAATGFIAGSNGSFIERGLAERGIHTSFVRGEGESRVCLNIIEQSSGRSTELLEQGPAMEEKQLSELKKTLRRLALQSSVVVLSGSLPPKAPEDLYAELIAIIRSTKAQAFLDASGAAFSSGLLALPYFIKPNEQELEQWLGKTELSEAEKIDGARQLASRGIAEVCVTLGGRGAIAFIDGEGYRVTPPAIRAVNTVGCGDSFVAGMAFALEHGGLPMERLRVAAAAASANAMSDKAGDIDYALFQAYVGQVRVTAL
ncbi:1-phosphofructokinase family hexose kinase [Paenibacillus algorifonticola]|uniref:1-phosphofructokinase family hexose kinase n=1 Tax=Paenibacillus algorifonticola TaxID=684063 RepID=UPI003D2BCFC7